MKAMVERGQLAAKFSAWVYSSGKREKRQKEKGKLDLTEHLPAYLTELQRKQRIK